MAAQPRNNMTSGFYRRVCRKNAIIKKYICSAVSFDLQRNMYGSIS
jgi:hypothetical protein